MHRSTNLTQMSDLNHNTNSDIRRQQQIVSVSSPQYTTTPFQRWYYQRNIQQVYSTFIVGAQYQHIDRDISKIDQQIFEQWITKSLSDTIYKNLTLALNIFDQGTIVSFLDRITLQDCVQFHTIDNGSISPSDQSLIKILHTIQETPLLCYSSSTLPMWRLHIINHSWFIMSFEHLLFDGLSGSNFHRHLFASLLNNITILSSSPIIEPIQRIPSSPTIDMPNVERINHTDLFYKHTLIQRLQSDLPPAVSSSQEGEKGEEDQTNITRLIPYPMEYHINTAPSWVLMGQVIGSEVAPNFLQNICSQVSQRIGILPIPSPFQHQQNEHKFYIFEKKIEEQDISTGVISTKIITPLTCISGKFDSHIDMIRISSKTIENIKNKWLKPHNLRLSPFLSYLFSIALLPITLNSSIGISIPTDSRKYAREGAERGELFRPTNDSGLTNFLKLNTNFDIGLYIGSFATKLRSILTYIPALSSWLTNPPNSTDAGLDVLKEVWLNSEEQNVRCQKLNQNENDKKNEQLPGCNQLMNIPYLQHISNSFKHTLLDQPDTNINGLFNGMGMCGIGDKLIGLDNVIKSNTTKPERDSTLEVSNLGLVKFDIPFEGGKNNEKSAAESLQVTDMFFSQPATRGSYWTFNVVGLPPQPQSSHDGGNRNHCGEMTVMAVANSCYSKEDFESVIKFINFLLEQL